MTDKFKGKYRILCEYDQATKDFPRKLDGSYEDADCYISCQYGNKIFHKGRDILIAYVPSIGRGHNIIKAINDIDPNIIINIEETSIEILFEFKYKDSDRVIPLLKPKTSGANISPFSSKNRYKNKDFSIPDEEIVRYKEIVAKIPQGMLLSLSKWTVSFLQSLATRKQPWDKIKADMILKGLGNKEYIYSIGKWDLYIKYLKDKTNNINGKGDRD